MRKIILLVVVIAVIGAGWFLYFDNGETIANVSLIEAEFMNLENTLEFSGEVVPEKMYSVMSETGGTIKNLHVSEGSKVSKGDPLFDFDTTEVETLLREAELNYDILCDSAAQTVMAQSGMLEDAAADLQNQKAKVALALSQTTGYDLESFNAAFAQDIDDSAEQMASMLSDETLADVSNVTEASLPDAAIVTDNEIALAQLSVQKLKTTLARMSFASQIDGTVISLNIHKGEVLSPGLPAMVIADTSNTLISAYVYEKDVSLLTTGMDVKIYTDKGYYMGTITKIGKAASGVGDLSAFDNMTKVEILPDESFDKMPGAVIDLEIVLSEKKDVIALPVDCFTKDDCVYVVTQNDTLEKRAVITGFEDTFNVEILGGVYEGEKVVLSPENLEEGLRVSYDTGE